MASKSESSEGVVQAASDRRSSGLTWAERCVRTWRALRAHQERCAKKINGRWYEIDTGHYPMLSTPDELARIILAS